MPQLHGESTLLCLNLGLAMRLVLANGMSADVIQAGVWSMLTWLDLPCTTQVHAMERTGSSWSSSLGKMSWTDLDATFTWTEAQAHLTSAPTADLHTCTRICDCCFKLLSFGVFYYMALQQVLTVTISNVRTRRRKGRKRWQDSAVSWTPFIGVLVLLSSQEAATGDWQYNIWLMVLPLIIFGFELLNLKTEDNSEYL